MQSPQELLMREFQLKRTKNPQFSVRSFAKWLSLSPAQLSQMMSGKRPITVKSLKKISDRLGLSPAEKKSLFSSMSQVSNASDMGSQTLQLQEDQFRLISDWYHFAILSLVKLKDCKSDPRWISKRLGISVEDANQAMVRLERMGILQLKPKMKQLCDPISVTSDVPSQAIRKYHKQNLSLASEKIDTIPNSLREFQSISVAVNLRHIQFYRKLMNDFLQEVGDLSNRQSGSEIYNMNVQFFPITQLENDK